MLDKGRKNKRHEKTYYPRMGYFEDPLGTTGYGPDPRLGRVLRCLNEAERHAECRRVVRIVEEMQEIEKLRERGERQGVRKRQTLLHKQLSHYRPQLLVHPARRGWTVEWLVKLRIR